MATIDVSGQNTPIQGGTFGNKSAEHFRYVPTANLSAGDRVKLCKLEKGIKVLDIHACTEDNLTDLTLSFGFEYEDAALASLDSDVYFMDAVAAATAGVFRKSKPLPPPEMAGDAWLVVTFGVAAFPTTNRLDVVLDYDFRGKP